MAQENGTRGISWVNLLAGIWLILSPFMFSSVHTSGAATSNNIIFGAIILLLAIVGAISARATWSRTLNAILGAWVFFSPFILGFSNLPAALWNNLILGAIVFIVAVSGASMATTYRSDNLQPR